MNRLDKIAILLGVGLNLVVASLVIFASTNYIA